MIINLRGTSGSGKTHLARRIMDMYGTKVAYKREGRKQPIGYVYSRRDKSKPSLAVIGHYETACGGCDTLPTNDLIFDLVRNAHEMCHDVLFEGLLISSDVNRVVNLWTASYPVQVVALNTPLDVCLDSVNARRQAKTPGKPPVNPANTTSKHRAVQLSMKRLAEAGVPSHWLDRDAAFDHICRTLKL